MTSKTTKTKSTKKNKGTGQVWMGTSNVVVPGNKTTFPSEYQQKSRLTYYSSLFNSVEVNSTFKKLPLPTTFEKWSSEVVDNFRFAVKLIKDVTHAKRLQFNEDTIVRFIQNASNLCLKKGSLLIQFPASITADLVTELERILEVVQSVDDEAAWQMAVEFRHPSWYNRATKRLLESYNATMVLHDMPNSKNLDMTYPGDFSYIRYHGPAGDYRGSYSESFLKQQATVIRQLRTEKKDVYVYFNNTIGEAFANVTRLQQLVND